jgi:F-type H+-transporting ATPase subunit b
MQAEQHDQTIGEAAVTGEEPLGSETLGAHAEPAHEGTHEGAEHAEGGLPQFDPQWWPGQIAWLVIVFLIVLIFMRAFAVPRLGGAIEAREKKIADDIAEARRMKDEADVAADAARQEAAQARGAAQKVVAEARAKAQAEVAQSLAAEEAKLAEAGAAAEARIAAARDQAMSHVAVIASDAAEAIVAKLTGKAPTPAELAAAQAARG